MVNIYLIRHGRQNTKLCNIDVELSSEGCKQAELLRDRFKNYEIDALYCSNMVRARQTAEILNETLWLPVNIREGIKEISFGLLEGNTDEYNEEYFADFMKKQKKLLEDIPYPGGENGADVCTRAMPVIHEMLQSGRQNIAAVTHGAVIRVILAELFGKNQAMKYQFAVSLENTSITQLTYEPEIQRFYLQRFNDCAHLEGYPELHRKSL